MLLAKRGAPAEGGGEPSEAVLRLYECLKKVQTRGADVRKRKEELKLAAKMERVQEDRLEEMRELMRKRNPGVSFKSDRDRRNDNLAPLKRHLLDRGDDLDVRDEEGLTLLHKATMEQNVELVKELINLDVDVNATDPQGRPALHLATINGNIEIVKALLDGNVRE
jgi:ankyrin repeat protein